MIGVLIIFLLVVLVVAAIWGREAAQNIFQGGVKIAVVILALVAVAIIALAINIQPPNNASIQQSLQAGERSAYHVPLDNNIEPGASLRRPAIPAQQSSGSNGVAVTNGLNERSASPTSGVPPPEAMHSSLPSKPNFGFGYRPQNGFVIVTHVYPGSPADQSDITPGMRILSVDGTDVGSLDDVWQAQHRRHQIGDLVAFVVGDNQGSRSISVRLGSDAEPWGTKVNR